MLFRKKQPSWYRTRKFTVSTLAVIALVGLALFVHQTRPPDTPELLQPSLKDLAANKGIQLGNWAMPKLLNEKPYRDILTTQFNLALADNQPNWHFTDGGLRPTAKTYNFQKVDEVISFAEAHNMPVQAHHYVWGEEKWLPDWLKNGDYDKQELLDLIKDHIYTVGKRYNGRVQEWTVVNEAFTRGQHVFDLRDWWGDHVGDQTYIDQSFIWAREADPKSKLILNDFNNEGINDISNEMYFYIDDAKKRGVPIDGIGMQMHIDGSHPPTKDEVKSNMKRFAELGLDVYVTEFDVNMNEVKAGSDEKDKIEGQIYYEMVRACVETDACKSFSFLGITDKETWYNYMPNITDPRPLLFDKEYNPKPAYYEVRRALEED